MKEITKHKPIIEGDFVGSVSQKEFNINFNNQDFVLNQKQLKDLKSLVLYLEKASKLVEIGDKVKGWEVISRGRDVGLKDKISVDRYWICKCEKCGNLKEFNSSYFRTAKLADCLVCRPKVNTRIGYKKPFEQLPEDLDAYMEAQTPKVVHRGKLICGVGINDAPFQVCVRFNGRTYMHKAYATWSTMLQRCYTGRQRTYKNVSVANEWLTFSSFYKWWKENYIEGYDLDKDLLSGDVKRYSPETCCYLPEWINTAIMSKTRNVLGLWAVHRGCKKYTLNFSLSGIIRKEKFKDLESFHQRWLSYYLPLIQDTPSWRALSSKIQNKLTEFFSYKDILF